MQVFKAFLKVLRKRLPIAMIWIVVFLVISIVVSNTQTDEKTFSNTQLDVCVWDEDQTAASMALKDWIGSKHHLISVQQDPDQMLDALYYEQADYILTIQKGYAEKLERGETDDLFCNYHVHDSYASALMENSLEEYVKTVQAYQVSGFSLSDAAAQAEQVLSQEVPVQMESFSIVANSEDYSESFSIYFQYLPYVFLSVMVVALCPVILTLNQKELRNRTNCSCLSPNAQTMQIVLGSILFVMSVWLIFLLAAIFLNGTFFHGIAWYAVLNSFVFLLIAAAIAILIAAFSPSDTGVNVIANVIGLGMSFFCGIFVPQAYLGDGVLMAARFLPAYWYVKINNMLVGSSGEAFSLARYWQYLGIELLFVLVLFLAAAAVRKTAYRHAK